MITFPYKLAQSLAFLLICTSLVVNAATLPKADDRLLIRKIPECRNSTRITDGNVVEYGLLHPDTQQMTGMWKDQDHPSYKFFWQKNSGSAWLFIDSSAPSHANIMSVQTSDFSYQYTLNRGDGCRVTHMHADRVQLVSYTALKHY
jgi:hypothetical protein